jgi:phage terminase large subunit
MLAPIHRLSPYAPLPWQYAPLRDKSMVMLMTGSAGGGKSRCAAEKVHAFLMKYPGATGLVVRKAREFVTRSSVPMLWEAMGKEASGVIANKSDNTFTYPNGSILYAGGMKDDSQAQAVRSIGGKGGLDIVWMEEANAFTEQDYQELLTRLRGAAAPWRQIILTTNPDSPAHWINQRLILKRQAAVYYSAAADNAYNPTSYQETLNLLTGTQYERLVLGRWVQAEGVVYDNFSLSEGGNVTEEAEYNPDWPIVWGVDDGYSQGEGKGTLSHHPRVFLLAQFTPQGGLNIFKEYYKTLEVEETSLNNVIELGYPLPDIAYVDSSAAQLKSRIWNLGIQTIGATHVVTEGIKNVRRLICDGNGVRLLKVHPRCTELINEFQSYSYGDSVQSVNGERKPLKLSDHGVDCCRYLSIRLRYD